jgi:hypothetical protein
MSSEDTDSSPETGPSGKREVPPLFLSPGEKKRAEDLTPPGLSNPFWNSKSAQ